LKISGEFAQTFSIEEVACNHKNVTKFSATASIVSPKIKWTQIKDGRWGFSARKGERLTLDG